MESYKNRYLRLQKLMDTPEGRREVVRTLENLKETKDLSFGEKQLLDRARDWEGYQRSQAELRDNLERYCDQVLDGYREAHTKRLRKEARPHLRLIHG